MSTPRCNAHAKKTKFSDSEGWEELARDLEASLSVWMQYAKECDRKLADALKQAEFGANMLIKAAEEKQRADKAEAECMEQARLLGMSAEREADLLGKLERAERERDEARAMFKYVDFDAIIQVVDELHQLRADLAAAREALRNCAIAASGGRYEQIAWIVEGALAARAGGAGK